MLTLLKLMSTTLIALTLFACGGGGGSEDAPPATTLRAYTSYRDFVLQELSKYIPADAIQQRYLAYDNDFSSFPDTVVWANGTAPIREGAYINYAKINFPSTPNGELILSSTGNSRVFKISVKDLNNGAIAEGDIRLYYGIKNLEYVNFDPDKSRIPIMFILDEMVYRGGQLKCHSFAVMEGYLYGYSPQGTSGPAFHEKGEIFGGHYDYAPAQHFVEPAECAPVSYENWLIREG